MVQLTVQGDDIVIRAFARIQDKSMRGDLMDEIGAYGVSSTQQRFIDGQGPGGINWKKSFRARQQNGQTLRADNHLFNSLTHDFNDSSVSWGTNIPYAGIHQHGGTIRPKAAKKLAFKLANGRFVMTDKVEMPARPFLGIDDDDGDEIKNIAVDWMKECLNAR